MKAHPFSQEQIRDAFEAVSFDVPVVVIVRRAKRLRRRRLTTFALAPLAILGMGAGGYALLTADELHQNFVICLDHPDLEHGHIPIGATGDHPIDVCAELWLDGTIDPKVTEVPPLKACVVGGQANVFPSGDPDLCTRLGLQELPEGYEGVITRFVEMRQDMMDRLRHAAVARSGSEATACLDERTARRIIKQTLSAHGYDEWKVVMSAVPQRGECAQNLMFDDAQNTITINLTNPGEPPSYSG